MPRSAASSDEKSALPTSESGCNCCAAPDVRLLTAAFEYHLSGLPGRIHSMANILGRAQAAIDLPLHGRG